MCQLIAEVADLEITPHPIILAVACFEVELAQGWRHFFHDTVVAESWVVVIGIDAPK
jgi:hypothetical protein